jgi:FlaG/FlaF family flagellin (archaellin)
MEKPYAIVNSSNVVVNVTIWDGNTETWQPDTGETAIDIGDDTGVMIGMTYNSSGTGIGNKSDNKWIIPSSMEIADLGYTSDGWPKS